MNIPALYNYQNAYNADFNPSAVHVSKTGLSWFFKKYLLQKALSVFKWELPKHWAKDYFLYSLYCNGFCAVINTDAFGVIPQNCGLSGYDVFYRPTTATISNPLLSGFKELRIGKQCTLFKLNPDYTGIMDIVGFYGDMLALCAQTAGVNILNSKLSYIFLAKNKASAETFKKLYDRIASGEPASVIDKDLFGNDGSKTWDMFSQNVGQNYIAGDVLADMRKWETMFDTEIGIPNANTDKKERLLTDEVNANNVETMSKCEIWLESFKDVCEQTNAMFGTSIGVDWRVKPENIGGAKNGDVVDTGTV